MAIPETLIKTTVRMDRKLKGKIEKVAKVQGVTFSEMVRKVLQIHGW